MNMTDERRLGAPRERIWRSLTDPQALRSFLPGCERLDRAGERDLTARLVVGSSAIAVDVRGQIVEQEEPRLLRMAFEAESQSGTVPGEATLRLEAVGDSTMLSCHVTGGGEHPDRGAADARRMLGEFLDRLAEAFGGDGPGRSAAPMGATSVGARSVGATSAGATPARLASLSGATALLASIPAEPFGFPRVAWIGMAIFAVIFVMIFGSYVL